MTAFAPIPAAVEAMRLGVYDYIQKPFDPDDVSLIVHRALQRHREDVALTERASPSDRAQPDLAALSYREALGLCTRPRFP